MPRRRDPTTDDPSPTDTYGAGTYGRAFADVYDEWYHRVTDVEATTALISSLATETGADAPILELGVGTGRLALPLARTGHEVHGIDASPEMLARLRAHDPAGTVVPHLGDMGRTLPAGPFSVVFAAYNTFFNLVDEDSQRSCLMMIAERLTAAGVLVIEAFTPAREDRSGDRTGGDRGVEERTAPDGGRILNATIRDPSRQTITGQHIHIAPTGEVVLRPWMVRYLHPEQLDEMASGCGLRPVARWGDWDRGPFGPTSPRHVSVYRRDP